LCDKNVNFKHVGFMRNFYLVFNDRTESSSSIRCKLMEALASKYKVPLSSVLKPDFTSGSE
jgi:hypothetical protein